MNDTRGEHNSVSVSASVMSEKNARSSSRSLCSKSSIDSRGGTVVSRENAP